MISHSKWGRSWRFDVVAVTGGGNRIGGPKVVANKWPDCLYELQMRTTVKLANATWIWLIQQLFRLIVCQCHITIIAIVLVVWMVKRYTCEFVLHPAT